MKDNWQGGSWSLLAGLAAFGGLLGTACGPGRVHVFGAYRYETGGDCLEGAAAVDVIDGPDPGACNASRCWISPAGEVYVTSTACDGPPDYVDHTKDPAGAPCARALVAFARTNHGACPAQPDAGN